MLFNMCVERWNQHFEVFSKRVGIICMNSNDRNRWTPVRDLVWRRRRQLIQGYWRLFQKNSSACKILNNWSWLSWFQPVSGLSLLSALAWSEVSDTFHQNPQGRASPKLEFSIQTSDWHQNWRGHRHEPSKQHKKSWPWGFAFEPRYQPIFPPRPRNVLRSQDTNAAQALASHTAR